MNYFLIAKLNGVNQIFGRAMAQDMAVVSGRWNAAEAGATGLRVVPETKLPKGIKWFDQQ